MPKSLIEVRRSYTPEEAAALLAAVHGALVAAFRIPETDRGARLIEHDPAWFEPAADLPHPDRYTIVTIDCFAGRTIEAKRRLYAEIAERFDAAGVPRGHVTVILHEITRDNWGMLAGVPASDVDLGFAVEV